MKRKEITDLHTKTIDELQKALGDLKNDVSQLSIDKAVGKIKNVNEARAKKKDIARIYTVLSEKLQEVLLETQAKENVSSKDSTKEEKNG